MPQYKLYYFNGRGRAEVIRLIFAAVGQEFEDIRFEREDWPKYKPLAPFGQVPFIEVTENGRTYQVSQSCAVARFLSRRFGLDGGSELEKAEVDMYTDQILDLTAEMVRIYHEKNEEKKKEIAEKFQSETLPANLKIIEAKLAKTNSGFLVGASLTWLDLFLIHVLEWLGEKRDLVCAHFPLIKAHDQLVRSMPKIAEWLEKRPVTAM